MVCADIVVTTCMMVATTTHKFGMFPFVDHNTISSEGATHSAIVIPPTIPHALFSKALASLNAPILKPEMCALRCFMMFLMFSSFSFILSWFNSCDIVPSIPNASILAGSKIFCWLATSAIKLDR